MRSIRLITGNQKKVDEYMGFATKSDIALNFVPLSISLPELQEENLDILMNAKVEVAKTFSDLPFCIDDASFWSRRYPGFPGNFMKFVNSTLGIVGLQRLFDEGDHISAIARIALYINQKTFIFDGRIEGTMTFKNIEDVDLSMPMNSLFRVNETGKTLGESIKDAAFLTHRQRAISALIHFLETEKSLYQALPCE